MYLPLRVKFLLVAGGASAVALVCALFVLTNRLESRMASQIADMLLGAESNFVQWKNEHRKHLSAEARIVANDPRFFAAVAEGDEATALPTALDFLSLAASDLFLVCDKRGRPLAHLEGTEPVATLDWPHSLPPVDEQLRYAEKLYLVQTQAVVIAADTVGYVALGRRVNEQLASTMARVAGADVLFFDAVGIFGSTISPSRSLEYVKRLKSAVPDSGRTEPLLISVDGERVLCRVGHLTRDHTTSYAVIMSLDGRLAPHIADLRNTVLWVGWLALVLAFAMSWAAARRMTSRVPKLVAAVEAVARGQYDQSVRHEGHDELRVVAEAVDRMRHELAAQIGQIRKANSEKLAAERLAVIGKMSSTIIHDFKTPIQIIRTAVELSSGPNVRPNRRQEYARMIQCELDRMVGMAQDLLSFARGDRRMAHTETDINEFMDQAVTAWREICDPKGIVVRYDAALPSTNIAIDRDKIRRALDNIVTNAMEALESGGTISIVCGRDGHGVSLSVSDNGPGIPAEIRDSIFEPFATFGKDKGTGLGLAMARKAVMDHGGRISVESAPGAGSTFRIVLPVAHDGARLSQTRVEVEDHATTLA